MEQWVTGSLDSYFRYWIGGLEKYDANRWILEAYLLPH